MYIGRIQTFLPKLRTAFQQQPKKSAQGSRFVAIVGDDALYGRVFEANTAAEAAELAVAHFTDGRPRKTGYTYHVLLSDENGSESRWLVSTEMLARFTATSDEPFSHQPPGSGTLVPTP
jgi:hypothetical protein